MSENTENQTDKKVSPTTTAVIVAFAAIFIILGFLFLTKDQRSKEDQQATETDQEQVVEGAATEDKDKKTDEDAKVDINVTENEEDATTEEAEEVYYPDLIIHEYTLSKEEPKQNEEFTVHIEIVNDGDADAEGFSWEWWADDNTLGCDGDVDWLDMGDKETVECEYTYDDYGTFSTSVVIDSDDDVDESDETNNIGEENVNVLEEEYIDLSVSEYSFDPIPEMGVPFTVRIGIKNNGNIAAEDFYWEWWGTAYNYACREHVASIAPNSTKVVTCNYTYGGWSTYATKAMVDSDNDVGESNEDNNVYQENVVPIH